jgi:hypothetical protein
MACHASRHCVDGAASLAVVQLEQSPQADPASRDVVTADSSWLGDRLWQQRGGRERNRACKKVPSVHAIEARRRSNAT